MKFGPYDLGPEVGRGAFGVVHRATAPDGRAVALKVLSRLDGDAGARFEREARLLGKLAEAGTGDAAGFVPLLDSGREGGVAFLVMPFLGGGTLRSRMNRPLSIEEALRLVIRLARALGRAHAQGIVHRDLKPENVLFSDAGDPFVADLGLAKHFRRDLPGASQSVQLSGVREMRGSVGYMAPEQMHDAAASDARADVFALGAILHECLAGEAAFPGESVIEVIGRVERGERRALRALRPEAPAWVETVLDRALAPDPGARYASGESLARALEGGLAGGATAPSPLPLLVPIGAVAAVIVALGVFLWAARVPPTAAAVPPPAPPPRSAPPIPATSVPLPCRTFARTRAYRLAQVLGGYASKHAAMAHTVVTTPRGDRLVSTGIEGAVHVWDARTGEDLLCVRAHDDQVTRAAVTRDGTRVLTLGLDARACLIELATGKVLARLQLERRKDSPVDVVMGEDASAFIGCEDGVIREVALSDLRVIRELPVGHPIQALAGRGDRLYPVSAGTLHAVDVTTGAVRSVPCGKAPLRTVAVAGARVIAAGEDDTVRVFDATSLALVHEHPRLHALSGVAGRVGTIAPSPDGTQFLITGWDDACRVRDTETGEVLATLVGHQSFVTGSAYSPDGATVYTSGNDQTVRAWSVAASSETRLPAGHAGRCLDVARSPDGKSYATVGWDRTVRLWDAKNGRELLTAGDHRKASTAVAFSPSGRRLASLGLDGRLAIWPIAEDGEPTHLDAPAAAHLRFVTEDRLVIGSSPATLVELASNRRLPLAGTGRTTALDASAERAFTGSDDGVVRVFDLDTREGRELCPPTGVPVLALIGRATAPVGSGASVVRAIDANGHVATRDIATGAVQAALDFTGGPFAMAAISPDGGTGVLVAHGTLLRVVDLETGTERDAIDLGPSCDVAHAVVFEPDGAFLVATARGVVLRFEPLR